MLIFIMLAIPHICISYWHIFDAICTISSDWYGLVKILQMEQAVKVKENM